MKKKPASNKILVSVFILIAVIVIVVGFLVLSSPKKESVNNETNNNTNEEINGENNTVIPPVTSVNVSFGKSLRFTIKAANPQYKSTQDITIQYTLENTGNETLSISPDISNGIELKNSGGKIVDYTGNDNGVKVLIDSYSIDAGQKKTGSFIIKSNSYNLLTNGDPSNGYYNTLTAYIGDVNSNRLILRIMK